MYLNKYYGLAASGSCIRQHETQIVCVPYWIVRAFERAKYSLAECGDYQNTRKILSLNDMLDWQYLNDKFTYKTEKTSSWTERFSSIYLEQLFTNMTAEDKREYGGVIVPNTFSEWGKTGGDLEKDPTAVNLRLRLSQPEKSHESKGYRIDVIQNTIWVILEEDFFTQLKKPDIPLIFISDLLKNCYIHMSVPEVSSLSVFRTYLELVSSTA